jgi:hypothetical protein
MPRAAADSGTARIADRGFASVVKPTEKPKRPDKFRPMGRVSLAWEPDFRKVRAALGLPPEVSDGSDRSGNGRS